MNKGVFIFNWCFFCHHSQPILLILWLSLLHINCNTKGYWQMRNMFRLKVFNSKYMRRDLCNFIPKSLPKNEIVNKNHTNILQLLHYRKQIKSPPGWGQYYLGAIVWTIFILLSFPPWALCDRQIGFLWVNTTKINIHTPKSI